MLVSHYSQCVIVLTSIVVTKASLLATSGTRRYDALRAFFLVCVFVLTTKQGLIQNYVALRYLVLVA